MLFDTSFINNVLFEFLDNKQFHTSHSSIQSGRIISFNERKVDTKMKEEVFKSFHNGMLRLPNSQKKFDDIPWSKHSTFEGVELKHLLTAKDTNGKFSYHLVRIAPNKSIKKHIHETQLETHEVIDGNGVCVNDGVSFDYQCGTISIFSAGVPHEVNAGNEGIYLFAKFFPALC